MGQFGISLAKYVDDLNITMADISEEAIEVAKSNVQNLVKEKNINIIKSDMFENIEGKFDIIVINPPYIKTDDIKEYDLKYEPKLALDGGEDGLEFYRIIANEGYKYLNDDRYYSTRDRI